MILVWKEYIMFVKYKEEKRVFGTVTVVHVP